MLYRRGRGSVSWRLLRLGKSSAPFALSLSARAVRSARALWGGTTTRGFTSGPRLPSGQNRRSFDKSEVTKRAACLPSATREARKRVQPPKEKPPPKPPPLTNGERLFVGALFGTASTEHRYPEWSGDVKRA